MSRSFLISGLVAALFMLSGPPAAATLRLPTLGFEDDVDLVVSPNHQFMIVCEETEDGGDARFRIIDINPATGQPLGILHEETRVADGIFGFENGVDPIIICLTGALGSYLILLPIESEDGSKAAIVEILTDGFGTVIGRQVIGLGDLGFRPDVDGTWTMYMGVLAVGFFVLESEINDVRGVIAIDVDDADGDLGSCRLLSTDGRAGCGASEAVDWLPGLADGVDPIAYVPAGGSPAVLLIPVSSAGGHDLLRLEFDSDALAGNIPPGFWGYLSVKEANALGPRPLAFPGYAQDVDLVLVNSEECGAGSILVPVEGPAGGDLYSIDRFDGSADWVYSVDGDPDVPISGYEAGVDLLLLCGVPVAPEDRVVVPVENAAGNDADLLVVDLATGDLIGHAEDPVVNPGLTMPGYEVGVGPILWRPFELAVPQEGPGSDPGLVILNPDAGRVDALFSPDLIGFVRSVDPIVAPTVPPTLVLPVGKDDGSGQDVLLFPDPPLPAFFSFEDANAGLTLSRLEWDVDLGLINNHLPGQQWLYLAEEAPGGGAPNLRFESTLGPPGIPLFVVATEPSGVLPGSLYLADPATGTIALQWNDVPGIETGLDMANALGPVTPVPLPTFPRPTGLDEDGDPTLLLPPAVGAVREVAGEPGSARPLRLSHPNPFAPNDRLSLSLTEAGRVRVRILDVAGRVVRRLFDGHREAGTSGITWDGRNDRGQSVTPGIYYALVSSGENRAGSRFFLVR